MPTVRFRSGSIRLELSGSEEFVTRQILLLADYLGPVDRAALEAAVAPARVEAQAASGPATVLPPGVPLREPEPAAPVAAASAAEPDALGAFFRRHEPQGQDRQAEAALLFAYYLQRREGMRSLELRDLIRCCNRTGVDTRNFNRTLGALTRRGLFETLRHGHAYRLSDQGVAAVESRM